MGTTATTPVHLLSTTFDFTVRDNRPITVEGVIATLHRVETETPWRFEHGNSGVQHPTPSNQATFGRSAPAYQPGTPGRQLPSQLGLPRERVDLAITEQRLRGVPRPDPEAARRRARDRHRRRNREDDDGDCLRLKTINPRNPGCTTRCGLFLYLDRKTLPIP